MKQNKNKKPGQAVPIIQPISKKGRLIIAIGIGILVIGYIILTKTNPQGDNWASITSPFLIIGGYITVAIGIIS